PQLLNDRRHRTLPSSVGTRARRLGRGPRSSQLQATASRRLAWARPWLHSPAIAPSPARSPVAVTRPQSPASSAVARSLVRPRPGVPAMLHPGPHRYGHLAAGEAIVGRMDPELRAYLDRFDQRLDRIEADVGETKDRLEQLATD